MFLELIAAFFAALSGAGLAIMANWLSGGRLPRWITPVAAGGTMLGFAIVMEYTWYERTRAGLPDTFEVALVNESRAAWRPWTFAAPLVDRFAAIDRASVEPVAEAPEKRMAAMYFFGRWASPEARMVVVDCDLGRVAQLPVGEEGAGSGILWRDLGSDTARDAICT